MSNPHILDRTTFETSRLLEFFTEKELSMQIGSSREWWPVNLLKELIDNALDACESAGIPPEIIVQVEPDALTVCDNGPGLPIKTLERSLDYLVRVSDKNHYVSPTRGQLGNALKCVWAAPFVVDGERGRIDVITGGNTHRIDVTLDRIAQEPHLDHSIHPDGLVKNGTIVKVYWPRIASLLDANNDRYYYKPTTAYELTNGYAAFNPHAMFDFEHAGYHCRFEPTAINWQKWQPNRPTSPHWYDIERLRGLIAAYIAAGKGEMTVREFVSEFDGLKGTRKQKLVTDGADLSGGCLNDLIAGSDVSTPYVRTLLAHMQRQARTVKPKVLGDIGQEHLSERLGRFCDQESIRYKKAYGEVVGLPFVVEAALGIHTADFEQARGDRVVGLNWSATLKNPIGELSNMLADNRVNSYDPVGVAVHIACPRFEFTSRGKDRLDLPDEIIAALDTAVKYIAQGWKQAKRQADKEDKLHRQQMEDLRKERDRLRPNVKQAAYQMMERAYMKASANNTLPANARQIMYAARPLVLELTGGRCWKNSSYFTQELLPGYIELYSALSADWDVVYDARGKLIEPHREERTDTRVDLGTLAVRRYVGRWWNDITLDDVSIHLTHRLDTAGPENRYKFALFIEKEGFNELFESVNLADRFDLAIMSTKGMSVTAARELVANLSDEGVTILVLHDFDKAGFSIAQTLRGDTRRWQYNTTPSVIDIGLRLNDVEEMGLESEVVYYPSKKDPRENLRESGATEAECKYLVSGRDHRNRWEGERVELNAMTSQQMIDWLERKLLDIGVEKVIPDDETLESAFRRAHKRVVVQKAIDKAIKEYDDSELVIPDDLHRKIERRLDEDNGTAWDDALYKLAKAATND